MNPSVYDHYRKEDKGIYRVVGAGDREVTLLRVADPDGRRTHTGEVMTVTRDELGTFEHVPNPDADRSLTDSVVSFPETAYWSVRVFIEELIQHPIPSLLVLGLIVIGSFGESTLPLPESAFGAMLLLGSISLAYFGSGRLSR